MTRYLTLCTLLYFWMLTEGCLPPSDPYPNDPPETVIEEAEVISGNLEQYIIDWLDGEVPSVIPDSLIPQGISDSKDFYLKHPEEVGIEEVWAVREAKPINKDSLYAGIPDPQVSYLYLGTALAPFGSKLVVEGEFPHCRFFSFQVTPPIDGKGYYANREFGGAEVSLVDVDIDPLPGHTNPFRLGADRTATERRYRVEFELAIGDGVALNEGAFEYPYLKLGNNKRIGALLTYQGPLGHKTLAQTPVENPGDWNLGALWVRIYQPDDGTGPYGGVPLPKVYYELPDGRQYFIGSDFSKLQERADLTSPNQEKVSSRNPYFGPVVGWKKSWGITRSILSGVCQANGWSRQDSAQRIRDIDLGWTGRGEFRPAPHNYEPHATTNNYINYLGRKVDILPGRVLVLTGKMPTFPSTRNGESVMEGGEVRYWSIAGIDDDPFSPLPATTIHAIGDDEVVLDEDRNYIIVYSHPDDRPENAVAANGVTWVNSGTQTNHGLLLRWLSVGQEWFTPRSPNEETLHWSVSDWAGTAYDSTLIDVNWREGHMQCFLPRVHDLSKAAFEALNAPLSVSAIPVWIDSTLAPGPAESRLAKIEASSVLDDSPESQPENALDGSVSTGWSSAFGADTAILTLDFDSIRTISTAKLIWDFVFFARAYELQYSTDGQNWLVWASANNENGQVDLFQHLPGVEAQYIRLVCTEANLSWYRLAEFEVFTGDCDCGDGALTAPKAESQPAVRQVSVFPNPAVDKLHFDLSEAQFQQIKEIRIWNAQGQLVRYAMEVDSLTLDISALVPGAYFIQFEGVGWQGITRFLVVQ